VSETAGRAAAAEDEAAAAEEDADEDAEADGDGRGATRGVELLEKDIVGFKNARCAVLVENLRLGRCDGD
jgi:hypothetical protein